MNKQLSSIQEKLRHKYTHIFISLVITAGIFFLLLRSVKGYNLIESLKNIDNSYLLVSLVFFVLTVLFFLLRWYVFLRSEDIRSFSKAFTSFMIALPFNVFIPSKFGDFLRVIHFKKRRRNHLLSSILLERIIDIFILVLAALIFSIYQLEFFYYILVFFIVFIIGFIVLLHIEKIYLINRISLFTSLSSSVKYYISKKKLMGTVVLLTVLGWVSSYLQVYYIFLALGIDLSFSLFAIGLTLATFVSMIPITIAGMGARETTLLYFFEGLATTNILLTAGLLTSFFRYWLLAILGLPFLFVFLRNSNNEKLD